MRHATRATTRAERSAYSIRRGLAIFVLFVLVAVNSVNLLRAFGDESWIRLATRIESTPGLLDMSKPYRERLSEKLAERRPGLCGDLGRSRVTVAMDLVRRAAANEADTQALRASIVAAEDVVRDTIACNPSQGNLWYVLAVLEQQSGSDWPRLQDLLAMSAAMSPRELTDLTQRSRFLVELLAGRTIVPNEALMADLRNAVEILDVKTAAASLSDLREGGRAALADSLVATASETRRKALLAARQPAPPRLGRPERYRHFDFDPFGRLRKSATPAP